MSGTYQPPKATVPKHIKQAIEESTKKLAGTPPGTPPQPAAPAAPVEKVELPPMPSEKPAVTAEPAEPVAKQAPAIDEFVVPQAPAAKPGPGPKPGETPEETIRRLTAALESLQGKYNKEVPGLMRENADLKKRIDKVQEVEAENTRLKQEKADLEKKLSEAPAKAVEPAVAPADIKAIADKWGVDAEELASFHNKTIDEALARFKASMPPAPAPAAAAQPTASEKPAEQKKGEQSPEMLAYLSTLDQLIGNTEQEGREIRKATLADPKFDEFLSLQDAKSGRIIYDIAKEANDSRNAVMMANIYGSFYRWKNTQQEEKKPSNLMPAAAGGAPGDATKPNKPVYTEAQEYEFQKRIRSGYYSGIGKSADEAKKLAAERDWYSNEFATARAEGRIRG